MATYSFKSAGKTRQQEQEDVLVSSPTPYGIKTPLSIATKDGILAMNYSLEEQFADNLRNLLQTNWGERLGLFQFGANLKPLTTEFVSQESFDNEAIDRIKNAVERWMPFIELEDYSSIVDRNENYNTGILRINITYNIPALEVTRKGLQVTLYVL